MKIFFSLFLTLYFSTGTTFGQDAASTDTIHHHHFNDGVYFSSEDLKSNRPTVKKEQLIKSYYDSSAFSISKWANTQNLYYATSAGDKQKVNRDSLWGYVENGIPYIYLNDRFHKFSTSGAVSVFRESYPNLKAGLAPVVTEAKYTSQINLFILANGRIDEFTPENVALAIEDNKDLYDELMALKSLKQKRKKMYRFVERYNDIAMW